MAVDTTAVYIDFEVLKTNSCKSLKVLDMSNWSIAESDGAYISILTPGNTKPINHVFQKNQINSYNVVSLNLSDIVDYSSLTPLPDGIYTISLMRCLDDPNEVTKYWLQDCQIRCQVARKLISVDLICTPCRKELLKEIQDIILFLDAAQAQTDSCNVSKAMEYYRYASTLLERISESGSTTSCKTC